jgi:site-specific DNA-methyltransferase (adenine-specific)
MIGATFSKAHYDLYKETGNKNLFEEVLDKLVMDEHLDLDQDVKDYIMSEDIREDKRIFILSNLLKEKSLEIVNSFTKLRDCETRTEHLSEALLTLNKYIEVGQQEVKKYGEVFTPLSLVKEMVATLPEEVWSNPNLKWLDPANGMGNFPLIVIYKLMKGLKSWEPDTDKRYKHIIENMIYVCELQPRNAFMYLSLVDPKDDLNVNLYCGSFLEEGFNNHMKQVWDIEKFDIVLGNPPYNEEFSNSGTAMDLFDRFILKSGNYSDVILMITPSRWFSKKNLENLRDYLINGISFIKTYDKSSDIFPSTAITGGVSYFLFNKNNINGTIFDGVQVSLKEQINLFGIILYDQKNYDLISSIVKKVKGYKKINNFNTQGYFGIKTNNIQKSGFINCFYSDQKGIKFNMNKNSYDRYYDKVSYYNDVKNKINKWKVITSSAYGANPKGLGRLSIICPGEICSESFVFFDFDSLEESNIFLGYLNSKIIKLLISLRKNKQHVTSKVFELVPMVPFDREWKDEMLYEYFNLTQEEIDLIEDTVR